MMTENPKRRRDRGQRGTWWTLTRRRWAYAVLVSAGGITAVYGVTSTEELAAWLVLGAALLGVGGLALANPTKE